MTGKVLPAKHEYNMLNMMWTCEEAEPCKLSEYKDHHFKTVFDEVKNMALDGDIQRIKDTMREGDDAIKKCFVTEFKHEKGPEVVAFCV